MTKLTETKITYRKPNENEQFIIERCVRNIRYGYLELFILLSILNLISLYIVYLSFTDDWISGILMLVLTIAISLFQLTTWFTIKESYKKKEYKIESNKGEWKIEYEGTTPKTKQFVSKINDIYISMVVPGMEIPPQYKKPKIIKYEQVKILETPPPFGYNYLFMSIEGKMLGKKDSDFVKKIKPLGLTSIVLSIAFVILFLFFFIVGNKNLFLLNFVLLIPLGRTLYVLIYNKRLKKDFINNKIS